MILLLALGCSKSPEGSNPSALTGNQSTETGDQTASLMDYGAGDSSSSDTKSKTNSSTVIASATHQVVDLSDSAIVFPGPGIKPVRRLESLLSGKNKSQTGKVVAENLSSSSEWKGLDQELNQARQEYFQVDTSDSNFNNLQERYGHLLWMQDSMLIRIASQQELMKRSFGRVPIGKLTGRTVPKAYADPFRRWVQAVAAPAQEISLSQLRNQLSILGLFSKHEYEAYAIARDRYEYWTRGKESDFFQSPEAFWIYVAISGQQPIEGRANSYTAAVEWMKQYRSWFGQDVFNQTMKKLIHSKRNKYGKLANPQKFGLVDGHVGEAGLELLAQTSPRNCALAMMIRLGSSDAEASLKEYMAKYGKERVEEAGRIVMEAPRIRGDYRLFIKASSIPGAKEDLKPKFAFLKLLEEGKK